MHLIDWWPGISSIQSNNQAKIKTIELIWQNVSSEANGRYECRYVAQDLNSVTVESYDMIVIGDYSLIF